ncbi:MAG: diphosphomevalonate decarboxylase [Candidatus Micrarchaeia archaeon]
MADGSSTWIATPNIAVIKYWGRRDASLNLPCNGSISITLDETVKTKTTVKFDSKLAKDMLILNGKAATVEETKRASRILDFVRRVKGMKLRAQVVSENNFPTGAGIASSASGFAALSCAACDAADLRISKKELSMLARLGSGSACRSALGGFVEWKAGVRKDGRDSYATQVAPRANWPEIIDIVAIIDSKRKKIGSEEGMDITVKTSSLFQKRLREVPNRIAWMKSAIDERDFPKLAGLAMEDSDSMHASMAGSKPPISYLNGTSRAIMAAVLELNRNEGKTVAGYTFDAGPNAHVLALKKDEKKVAGALKGIEGVERLLSCGIGNGPRKAAQ